MEGMKSKSVFFSSKFDDYEEFMNEELIEDDEE